MPKNLKELKQVDGKVHPEDESIPFEPTTLEQLLGATALSSGKYDTDNKEEYLNELSSFSMNELRSHAVSKGIVPRDVSKERLIKQLLAKFTEHTSRYRKPVLKQNAINKHLGAEATKIMSSIR